MLTLYINLWLRIVYYHHLDPFGYRHFDVLIDGGVAYLTFNDYSIVVCYCIVFGTAFHCILLKFAC